jgi:hypothetical protein
MGVTTLVLPTVEITRHMDTKLVFKISFVFHLINVVGKGENATTNATVLGK